MCNAKTEDKGNARNCFWNLFFTRLISKMSTERKTAGSKWGSNLKFKDEILALVLAAVILVSILFSSLPLVHADYTVSHASFPPDLPGDLDYNGIVNMGDVVIVLDAFGSYPGKPNWNAGADVDDSGRIDMYDVSSVLSDYGRSYNTSPTPVAYSTSFEFKVPDDGNNIVWYYVLVRIYVPQTAVYNFIEDYVDDWVLNVKIDNQLKYGGSTSDPTCTCRSVSLGSLSQGYHLVEFNFVEQNASGGVMFHVATANGDYAWLDRFRVCVPNYSDVSRSYSVISMTNFTKSDRYFIKGNASDSIDNVKLGGGWLYQDWQWGTLYGWGDGFNVPTGWLDPAAPRSIEFRYNVTNGGILDFSVVSFTKQPARIARGTPEFRASVSALYLTYAGTISNQTLYAGSEWYGDPGISERKIIVSQQFYIASYAYDGGPLLSDAKIRFDVSIARLDAVLNSETSFAIALNLTYLGGVMKPADYVWINSVDINVRVPSQALNVLGWEFHDVQGGKSIVDTGFKIVTSMTIASAIAYAAYFIHPVGAIVGLAAMGAAATGLLDFPQGTSETPFTVYSYDALTAHAGIYDTMPLVGSGQSISETGFVRVKPMQPTHCGKVTVSVRALISGVDDYTSIDFPVYV